MTPQIWMVKKYRPNSKNRMGLLQTLKCQEEKVAGGEIKLGRALEIMVVEDGKLDIGLASLTLIPALATTTSTHHARKIATRVEAAVVEAVVEVDAVAQTRVRKVDQAVKILPKMIQLRRRHHKIPNQRMQCEQITLPILSLPMTSLLVVLAKGARSALQALPQFRQLA